MIINNKPFDLKSLCSDLVVNTSTNSQSYMEIKKPSLYISNCGFTSRNDSMVKRKKMQQSDKLNVMPNEEVRRNPEDFIRSLTKIQRGILECLLKLNKRHKIIYVSQSTLAKELKVKRETINRNLRKLRNLGLVSSLNRGVKRTCILFISPFFKDPFIRSRLSSLLRPLMALPLAWILSTGAVNASRVTQYNLNLDIKNIDINNKHRINMTNYAEKIYGSSNVMSPAIRSIKFAQLTDEQKISLHKFPDEVITSCSRYESHIRKANNPFKYFYRMCLNYCALHSIEIDNNKPALISQMLQTPEPEAPQPEKRNPFEYPKERRTEDPKEAAQRIASWQESEAGKLFIRMFGNVLPPTLREAREDYDHSKKEIRATW